MRPAPEGIAEGMAEDDGRLALYLVVDEADFWFVGRHELEIAFEAARIRAVAQDAPEGTKPIECVFQPIVDGI